MRKKKWDAKYEEKRVVFWDDTNVDMLYKPSTAINQQITYLRYYASNCAKDGCFVQLCGWMGVEELWTGAISDSKYQIMTEIFKKQQEFSEKDFVNGKILPFHNILDKGYRVSLIAWREGHQTVSQPVFAKSDTRFTGEETITSASVAADRSGNERAVNVCKRSGYLQRGLSTKACPVRMSNIWLTWSFQTNFMFESVL